MRPGRGHRALRTVAPVAALALVALAAGGPVALSRPAQPGAATPAPPAPLRAVLYLTAPVRLPPSGGPRPAGSPPSPAASVRRDLAALRWAHANAAIVPWGSPGSPADRRLRVVLAAIASTRAHVRAVALIDRLAGSRAAQMAALARTRARAPGYLRIGSKPAVVVEPANRSLRGCARALRWRSAASRFWLMQATFPGYARCREAADAWFGDRPSVRSSRVGTTFLIRPGLWRAGARAPTLARSPAAWLRAVARMNTSSARVQIIDSLNDWVRGSAIGPSASWPSASGFGSYLDALHRRPQRAARRPTAPVLRSVSIGGVSAHQASLIATVAGGRAGAALVVEYGLTAAYGQSTAPVPVDAPGPRQTVTVTLPSLAAGTPYHARVSVISAAGTIIGADVAFATPSDPTVRVAAAGDIACDPTYIAFNGGAGTPTECQQKSVSDAIIAGSYDAVLPLGDEQYNSGTAKQFAASYDPSWGRLKAISHPVVGNHEYGSPGAAPYFAYFGAAAGDPGKGYYSYDLGSWHMVALNSNCDRIPGCGPGSPEETWLKSDLAAHPARCTLAYWHHPRFSSGQAGDATAMDAIWSDLVAAGAEVVLAGHDHEYERFEPLGASGRVDAVSGIREFVVGTGGKNHMRFKTIEATSVARDSTSFGFLELALGDGVYSWRFVSVPAGGFSDSGTGSCH
jgi:hypothetical protein